MNIHKKLLKSTTACTGVSLRIQSECGKIRTRKNSVFGHFSRSEVFKHWTQLLVSSEDFKISTDCLAECWKVLATCFETNAWLSFLVIGKHSEFLKIWSAKKHTYKQSFISLLSTLKSLIQTNSTLTLSLYFCFFCLFVCFFWGFFFRYSLLNHNLGILHRLLM